MPRSDSQVGAPDHLRGELEAIRGVQRAVVDGPSGEVVVVGRREHAADLQPAIEAILEKEGIAAEALELFIAVPAKLDAQRRVRFVGAELEHPRANYSVATVTLEWMGESFSAAAEGEGGIALELRVCAQATVDALQQILAGEVTFQLVGVKAIRIFDNDLVAVLLHSPQAPDRRLVGLSLVAEDAHRSGAIAVLNATNRLLGNYLQV